jgi:hypothetical protein
LGVFIVFPRGRQIKTRKSPISFTDIMDGYWKWSKMLVPENRNVAY